MGSREDRLLAEQLERMADLGVEPAALPPVGAAQTWSPDDIAPAEEIAGGDVDASPDTSEESPTREDGPSSPAMPACEIPNEGHYIGLKNGSQPGPDGWKPAVTPAEERMIFGAPVNRTVAEVEGAHGSPELDADAEKLIAMGEDPGPTIQEFEAAMDAVIDDAPAGSVLAGSPIRIEDCADPETDPDFAEVEGAEPGGDEPFVEIPLKPAWAVGDLCVYADGLAEILFVDEEDGSIRLDEIWPVPMKSGFKWERQRQYAVDPVRLSVIAADIGKLLADAYRQHKQALAAEGAAAAAHATADRLVKAHFALADASAALAEIGQTVAITAA